MNRVKLSELMVKIKNDRDEMAFSDLFDFLAPKLKTYFIQNGFRPENSEELVQEVLSNVWSKSDKYDSSKSAVSTWVYTIARNKKIDFLRKTSRVEINEDDVREFLYSNNEIDNIDENEAKNQIDKINKELNPDQRKMIKMNFFENKSHKKIADELEIPLGTVKSRIRNILVKMQRLL